MQFTITAISPEKETPRYAFGKIDKVNYAVLTPIETGDNTYKFKLGDILKPETSLTGTQTASNQRTNEEIFINIYKINITADEIRRKYYPRF